jgi:hypothetical protein
MNTTYIPNEVRRAALENAENTYQIALNTFDLAYGKFQANPNDETEAECVAASHWVSVAREAKRKAFANRYDCYANA